MKNRVLVIGMNPSSVEGVKKNSTLHRLNNWMDNIGITHYSFMNVIEKAADKVYHGDVDPSRLRCASLGYNKVIALGGFASESLDKARINHFKMPHPSPRNRLLNDKKYEKDMVKQMKHYLGV